MILYYVPGACSQACHIALIEVGMSYQINQIGRDWQTQDRQDFSAINPKRYVPALDLGDGTILTENLAILAYIADRSGKLLAKDGLVEEVGSRVTGFAPGDEVMGQVPMMKPGAFAETAITTADLVIRKPASLSHPAAAALPTVAVTAWRALVDGGKLRAGQSVFINGASGGVGQAAIAVAKSLGAVITARVGPSSVAGFADLGLARVLDYTQLLPDDLKGAFDVVFDCHGSLRPAEEDFLTKRSGVAVNIDPTVGNLIRSLVSRRHSFVRGVLSTSILQKIADLAVAGQFTVPISRTVSLSEAIPLIAQLETGNRLPGKSVIVMG